MSKKRNIISLYDSNDDEVDSKPAKRAKHNDDKNSNRNKKRKSISLYDSDDNKEDTVEMKRKGMLSKLELISTDQKLSLLSKLIGTCDGAMIDFILGQIKRIKPMSSHCYVCHTEFDITNNHGLDSKNPKDVCHSDPNWKAYSVCYYCERGVGEKVPIYIEDYNGLQEVHCCYVGEHISIDDKAAISRFKTRPPYDGSCRKCRID